jgi:Ni/Fe-hydrogenase subunit HybB-like protein
MSAREKDLPVWRQPLPEEPDQRRQTERAKREHLLLDARNPLESDQMMLEPMQRVGRQFWLLFAILGGLVIMLFATWVYQMNWGIGVTGLLRPVMWAVYIVNFVYFIGIGHAGTFISAALRALKFEWRRPISRAAEVVTVFGLMSAALFPLIHLGRSWKFYYLIPFPNQRQIWPSFHSPLMWDFIAISTYLSCSMLFAYIGLLPDLAMARDHTTGWRHRLYSFLALGWRGTEAEWAHHETAMNVFTYAIIPVMFSVHTIVSWDFAMALQPGWHSTIFGPYFVVGALFSGAGAVIIALIVVRKALHLEYFIRPEHFNGMAMFMLVLSLAWDYFYFNDFIVPWYGQGPVEKTITALLTGGRAAPFWYLMIFSNVILPAATLWSKKLRTNLPVLFIVSFFVQVGMYLERVVIIPILLGQNELPFSWGVYSLQLPETLITIGAFAFLLFNYLLFTKTFPIVPVWEVHEGQIMQSLRRIGRAVLPTRTEE